MSINPYLPPSLLTSLPSGLWSGAGGLPVLPYLPGQSPKVSKKPVWSTEVITTASGRERRTAYWPYPKWAFELSYGVIRHQPAEPELQALWEFFNTAQGQFATWLFVDPADCRVGPNAILNPHWSNGNGETLDNTGAPILDTGYWQFGTGDGSTRAFTLSRPINSWVEPVYAVYNPTLIDNGSPAGAYTISGGTVTFAAAPAAGHKLAWSGYFYFGCRFLQDDLQFDRIVRDLWSAKSLKFTSLRP